MIKQYRYPLSTHFYINPFKLLRRSYVIRQEWIDKTLIINWFPSTFCPILGHHQVCVYCKRGVIFLSVEHVLYFPVCFCCVYF